MKPAHTTERVRVEGAEVHVIGASGLFSPGALHLAGIVALVGVGVLSRGPARPGVAAPVIILIGGMLVSFAGAFHAIDWASRVGSPWPWLRRSLARGARPSGGYREVDASATFVVDGMEWPASAASVVVTTYTIFVQRSARHFFAVHVVLDDVAFQLERLRSGPAAEALAQATADALELPLREGRLEFAPASIRTSGGCLIMLTMLLETGALILLLVAGGASGTGTGLMFAMFAYAPARLALTQLMTRLSRRDAQVLGEGFLAAVRAAEEDTDDAQSPA